MPTDKKFTAARLSETARELLEGMAEKTGLTRTALIEEAIRLLAKQKGVAVKSKE